MQNMDTQNDGAGTMYFLYIIDILGIKFNMNTENMPYLTLKGDTFSNSSNFRGHEKKPSYFPLYWWFNRDPYRGLLESPSNWVV